VDESSAEIVPEIKKAPFAGLAEEAVLAAEIHSGVWIRGC
jgi:hypothetical protein